MLNIYIFGAYLLGLGLDQVLGLTFFRVIPGICVVFYLPGIFVLDTFYRQTLSKVEKIAASVLLSIFINAFALYFFYFYFHLSLSSESITFLLLAVGLISAGIFLKYNFKSLQLKIKLPDFYAIIRSDWPILIGFLAYLSIHLINFLIYPFIPEADGYVILNTLKEIISKSTLAGDIPNYRAPFYLLCLIFNAITNLDLVIFFKYALPLITSVSLIPVYSVAKALKLPARYQLIATLLPLSMPIITQEIDYVRPQAIIIFSSFIVLGLLYKFITTKKWSVFALAAFFAFLGTAFHEFSGFLVVTVILSVLPAVYTEYRKNPKKVGLIFLYCFIATFPYLRKLPLVSLTRYFLSDILGKFNLNKFTWWFIDHYTNYNNNDLGWPGFQAFYYYGYNLGIAIPLLLILLIWYKAKKSAKTPLENFPTYPFIIFFALTFFLAEITPRFEAAYLPDRIWLFTSISLSFLLISTLRHTYPKTIEKLILLSIILSVLATLSVTYLKKGWIDRSEHKAAQWIKANTPTDSQFITQIGNCPLIWTYAERSSIGNPDFFFMPIPDRVNYIADTITHPTLSMNEDMLRQDSERVTLELKNGLTRLYTIKNMSENQHVYTDLLSSLTRVRDLKQSLLDIMEQKKKSSNNVYIMYSHKKFDNFYAKRAWWLRDNAYGANLDLVSQIPGIKKVLEQNGVIVWKYTPPKL